MLIHAKSDYAIRALLVLADRAPELVKLDVLVAQQAMPRAFLEIILGELRRAGMVRSRRGPDGGWTMSVPADRITIGEVIRVVDGPLGVPPQPQVADSGPGNPARHLPTIWLALTASLSRVLDQTTLEQVLTGGLPEQVLELAGAAG